MKNELESRLRELATLLSEMTLLHESLLHATRSKLGAMRTATTQAVQQQAAVERDLARRIAEREGLRRALMDRIGAALSIEPARARQLTLSQLAQRVEEPQRSRLQVLGEGLRRVASEIARINRVCALVGQEMLAHFRAVHAAITEGLVPREVYARPGAAVAGSAPAALIDMKG